MDKQIIHCGFDVHSQSHSVHFLRDDGSLPHAPFEFEQNRKGFSLLESAFKKMQQKHPDVIFKCGVEATGPYWFALGEFLTHLPQAIDMTVINPSVIHNYKKIHLKKVKTDPIDCAETADYMKTFKPAKTDFFTSQHITLRRMGRGRKFFVKQCAAAVNQLRGQLAEAFPEISGQGTGLSDTLLTVLEQFPSASGLSQATDEQLRNIRSPKSGRRVSFSAVCALRQKAKCSVGVPLDTFSESYIRELVQDIFARKQRIKRLEAQLEAYYLKHFSHTKIHTVKGIGPLSAALIMGEILDGSRFESIEHWIGYIGVYPEWKWSAGKKDPAYKMTKKGNRYLKHIIYTCVFSSIRFNPAVRKHYHNQLSRGKKKMVAIGSCMRKLAAIIFGVMKTERDFDALHDPIKQKGETQKKKTKNKGKKEEAPLSNTVANEVVNATQPFAGLKSEVVSPFSNG